MLLLERIDVLGKDITMELRQDTNVCPLLHDKILLQIQRELHVFA